MFTLGRFRGEGPGLIVVIPGVQQMVRRDRLPSSGRAHMTYFALQRLGK